MKGLITKKNWFQVLKAFGLSRTIRFLFSVKSTALQALWTAILFTLAVPEVPHQFLILNLTWWEPLWYDVLNDLIIYI
jgi:hypothetical protein